MKYQLASRREEAVTVDGLGVLQPGETYEVTEQDAEAFRLYRGLSLAQAALPQGVEVTLLMDETDTIDGPVIVKKETGEIVGTLEEVN